MPGKPLNAFPLLSEFYNKETQSFDKDDSDYNRFFCITERIEESDFIVLTHSLNLYFENNQQQKIDAFLIEVNKHNKPGWVCSHGDNGFRFRSKNIYHFRISAYESRLDDFDIIVPTWVQDPYANALFNSSFQPCQYNNLPQIGFCGQSTFSIVEAVKVICKVNLLNIRSVLSLSPFEINKQFYSPFHRKLVLERFRKSASLRCDFIEREKYRAGVESGKATHHTTTEYFTNIYRNPYSIAIRGGGNFSVRFFHICAMGRIPIFMNFDSPIPFKKRLLEKGLMVEINPQAKEYDREILNYHNQNYTKAHFEDIQEEIRNFWKEYYTKLGFYQQIYERFQKRL